MKPTDTNVVDLTKYFKQSAVNLNAVIAKASVAIGIQNEYETYYTNICSDLARSFHIQAKEFDSPTLRNNYTLENHDIIFMLLNCYPLDLLSIDSSTERTQNTNKNVINLFAFNAINHNIDTIRNLLLLRVIAFNKIIDEIKDDHNIPAKRHIIKIPGKYITEINTQLKKLKKIEKVLDKQ